DEAGEEGARARDLPSEEPSWQQDATSLPSGEGAEGGAHGAQSLPEASVVDAPTGPGEGFAPAPVLATQAEPGAEGVVARLAKRASQRVLGGLAVVVLGVVGLGVWLSFSRTAQVRALDRQLEMFDPLNPDAFTRAFTRVGDPEDAELSAREAFVSMLVALEQGEVLAEPDLPLRTAWGRGAAACHALQRRDFERALKHVGHMEREHPDALATWWVRARFEEERGAFEKSRHAYDEAQRRFERFVPGVLGRMRVAVRTGDSIALRQAARELQELNPLHPYMHLVSHPVLTHEEFTSLAGERRVRPDRLPGAEQERFMRAFKHYQRAARAWQRGDATTSRQAVMEALTLEPHFGPALLLHGALQAARLRHSDAVSAFRRLALVEGISVASRLELMIVAPRALTEAGRPDLGMELALWPDGRPQSEARAAARAPTSLALNPEQLAAHRPLEREALLSLARGLGALGKSEDALEVLELLDEREMMSGAGRLERVVAYMQLGRTKKREVALEQMEADPEQALGRALEHLLRGEDEEAMRVCAEARGELDVHPMWLRVYALALLRLGRTGELRALFEEMVLTPTYDVVRRRLELRIYAKLGHGNPEFVTTHEYLVAFDPTSVGMLVDLAMANFWQGRMADAMEYAEAALERAPRSPEANWIVGLVHRYNGDRGEAKRHLEAAFVTADDARLLVELGQVYLDLRQYERAQRTFYKAVLLDRKNLAAVRGMGESYALGDPT
ncbi:MAG: hypothetical protein AAGI01_15600, partial [Myxococcota bacterium]